MTDEKTPPEAALTQQQKAEAALQAIADGSNPAAEAYALANDFTDSQTERLKRALSRLLRRR